MHKRAFFTSNRGVGTGITLNISEETSGTPRLALKIKIIFAVPDQFKTNLISRLFFV